MSRSQKPTLRDFLLMHSQTRAYLCADSQIFNPCENLSALTSFEKATLVSWSADSNVDKGLNLYIVLHCLSAINNNSSYYHYVNNGSPDATNMFGHVIGTSGSGKSSALTPHMDAMARTLAQFDINQEYSQYPSSSNGLATEQPFIIANATALHVYRSLMYGNRLLCSTECDTLLTNFGVYGNQNNDPRFNENVNMLIQMFDGTKHQNRSNLSTSYSIPEGRRASIIGASVGDPYARVSQQHYEGNGISGAHNRFTHYPCPVTKAIKMNCGSTGIVCNMVPSLQHVYSVSILLGKVEYVPRQNIYDKSNKKQQSVLDSDIEKKWQRLRSMSNREYNHMSSQTEIDLEEPDADATFEQSKSAYYHMFNRVYNQWEEAILNDKEEHEAIIGFKNSTKIPRFVCNFARFRAILDILWHDDVYPFVEVEEVVKSPYRVSDKFIEAVKNVIDKCFPLNLRKDDGTKILIIEKETAIMGDIFFAHVDRVSRRLFDLSSVHAKFNSSPITTFRTFTKKQENTEYTDLVFTDAAFIIRSKFVFFSMSTFAYHRQFCSKKDRFSIAIEYLTKNQLVYQATHNSRFIKGTHASYAMATPGQITANPMSIDALTEIGMNINDYQQLWQQSLLPNPELAAKIDKTAINHIVDYLSDYIGIVHRLGNANDPIAREVLMPGLHKGDIGIDHNVNTFSISPEHISRFTTDSDIIEQLSKLCHRETDQTNCLLKNSKPSMSSSPRSSKENDTPPIHSPQPALINEKCDSLKQSVAIIDEHNQLQQNFNSSDEPCPNINAVGSTMPFGSLSFEESNIIETSHNDLNSTGLDNPTADSLSASDTSVAPFEQQKLHLFSSHVNNGAQMSTSAFRNPSSELSMSIFYEINNNNSNDESAPMETDHNLNSDTSFSPATTESMPIVYEKTAQHSNKYTYDGNVQSAKTFDVVALSKKLIMKPFITFTKTDATRLYNNAEAKNVVLNYLEAHGFIEKINNLFLSSVPTKKTFKPEIGYLKLFPTSRSAMETATFEAKLREKIGITFDDYVTNVFDTGKNSMPSLVINNMFNTTHHNWLLNRSWYDKLKQGHISIYFKDKVLCPDENMNPIVVLLSAVSNDDVHDPYDKPRTKLTASQRTKKELNRLGAKRQRDAGDTPLSKRQRKPKRFADDNE